MNIIYVDNIFSIYFVESTFFERRGILKHVDLSKESISFYDLADVWINSLHINRRNYVNNDC